MHTLEYLNIVVVTNSELEKERLLSNGYKLVEEITVKVPKAPRKSGDD